MQKLPTSNGGNDNLRHLHKKELNKPSISRHTTSLLYIVSAQRIFRNHSCRPWESAALSRFHLLHYLSVESPHSRYHYQMLPSCCNNPLVLVTFWEVRRRSNFAHIGIVICICTTWPPLWSSGQSFWLLIQRSRVRSPALPDFLSSSGSGTGSTQPREVNWGATWMKKVVAPGLENRD